LFNRRGYMHRVPLRDEVIAAARENLQRSGGHL
jgi:hypothetical protein